MTPRAFVDTSAWIAVTDASDARHALAAQTYLRLLKGHRFGDHSPGRCRNTNLAPS